MFITRAPLLVDLAYVVTLSAPVVTFWGVRLVRAGRLEAHRRVQIVMVIVAVVAVLLLEGQIRLSGGSGALLQGSRYAGTSALRWVAGVHIGGAVLTYLLWIWLMIVSLKQWRVTLPGSFSQTHRRMGWIVWAGLVFTAVSATGVYVMGFVL